MREALLHKTLSPGNEDPLQVSFLVNLKLTLIKNHWEKATIDSIDLL
jgi:hypothetical protein